MCGLGEHRWVVVPRRVYVNCTGQREGAKPKPRIVCGDGDGELLHFAVSLR